MTALGCVAIDEADALHVVGPDAEGARAGRLAADVLHDNADIEEGREPDRPGNVHWLAGIDRVRYVRGQSARRGPGMKGVKLLLGDGDWQCSSGVDQAAWSKTQSPPAHGSHTSL